MAKLIFPNHVQEAKVLSSRVIRGELRRVRSGIYTDARAEEIPPLLVNRWYEVVEHLCKDAIAAYRTAVELKPVDGIVFVVAPVKKRHKITVAPNLAIEILPGNAALATEQFVPGLRRSNLARQCLENLSPSRRTAKVRKSLGAEWVENQLCKELQRRGEAAVNQLRDEARKISPLLGLETENELLNKMISALLTTHPEGILSSELAIATAKREPFDQTRQALFEQLARYLAQCELNEIPYHHNKSSWRNLAFFESYYSNYIEGTEFDIEEAEKIVFERVIIGSRHEDSHDVMAVYDIVSDYQEMSMTPHSVQELLEILQLRHKIMLAERPDKRPGEFKTRTNKAGTTLFVSPDNLIGTLNRGFELYKQIETGLKRAIFMHFLIAECHPFDDGNGRLARIMLNAELHAAERHKLIVPIVHRDSYINGLRQATREKRFRTMIKVLHQLHIYSAQINWIDYDDAYKTLEQQGANKLPDEGIAIFNKIISKIKGNYPV